MRLYLFIAIISHFGRKTLVIFMVYFNVLPLIEGLVFPKLSKHKGVVLRVALVCIEGGICIRPSCLTLVSLSIMSR